MLAAFDWTPVALAMIAAVPATLAAILGYMNHRAVKTPNGGTLGAKVEDMHQLVTEVAPIMKSVARGDIEIQHRVTMATDAPPAPPPPGARGG